MSEHIAERYGERNPRTADEPMAFTFGEFVRGAFGTLGWFLLCSTAGILIVGTVASIISASPAPWAVAFSGLGYLLIGWPFVLLPVSLVALLIGAPGAFALGWGLRRTPSVRVHVTLFSLYGVVFGSVATWLVGGVLAGTTTSPAWYLLAFSPIIVASGLAFGLGRYRAIRRLMPAPISCAVALVGDPE